MIGQLEVHRPTTLAEAADSLREVGDEAAVYAGGTELLLVMKLGFADYPVLVDVKGIPELATLERRSDGSLFIGAAVTHRSIERAPVVNEGWRALARMTSRVANVRVRSTGTLGGNLCFADPHSDPATFLLAAGADVMTQRPDGSRRRLPIEQFILGMYTTALEDGELLVGVEVPSAPVGVGIGHEKFAVHERPTVTVATRLQLDDGRLTDVRLVVGSIGPSPVRLVAAEGLLEGTAVVDLHGSLWDQVGMSIDAEAEPVADGEGSAEYKHHLLRLLAERAVGAAVADAGR